MTSSNERELLASSLMFLKNKMPIYYNLVQNIFENTTECISFSIGEIYNYLLQNTKSDTENEDIDFKIKFVLDYLNDELNTGHWRDVPINLRKLYTFVSFLKVILAISKHDNVSQEKLEKLIRYTDMGLIMGAPLSEEESLSEVAGKLMKLYSKLYKPNLEHESIDSEIDENCLIMYKEMQAEEIQTIVCPGLNEFSQKYFKPQQPVHLLECLNMWPALSKWKDLNYFSKLAGKRIVPIEIGSHYVDENWTQKLMTLDEYIDLHFKNVTQRENIGYLAQHNLFDQITELRNDILIPDYCALSEEDETSEPDINAWFGPKGTVSPLHYDPKHNLLAQVIGSKQVLLFSPLDSQNLYPFDDLMLKNTAQIDPINPNVQKFPNFKKAKAYKIFLKQGQMLYIPPKWWHHITSLQPSFSVSFWWT